VKWRAKGSSIDANQKLAREMLTVRALIQAMNSSVQGEKTITQTGPPYS